MSTSMHSTEDAMVLDWRGLLSPEPLLRAARAVRALKGRSAHFELLFDDPDLPKALALWASHESIKLHSPRYEPETGFRVLLSVYAREGFEPASASQMADLLSPPAMSRLERLELHMDDDPIRTLSMLADQRQEEGFALEVVCEAPDFEQHVMTWARSLGAKVVWLDPPAHLRALVYRGPVERGDTDSLDIDIDVSMDTEDVVPTTSLEHCALLALQGNVETFVAALDSAQAALEKGMSVTLVMSGQVPKLLRESPSVRGRKPGSALSWLGRQLTRQRRNPLLPLGDLAHEQAMRTSPEVLGQRLSQLQSQGAEIFLCPRSLTSLGFERHDLVHIPELLYGGVDHFVEHSRQAHTSLVF